VAGFQKVTPPKEDSMRKVLCGLLVMAITGLVVRADDEKEEKVPLDKLPKAVVEAVKAKFPKAELVSAEKENEDGKIVYEVAIKNEGSRIEVIVTPEGKILVVEKEIESKDVPQAVKEALKKKYPEATVKKIEEIIKNDKTEAYEFLLVTGKKKTVEVKFAPDGKFLEEEKKGEEKKDKDEKKDKKKGEDKSEKK
jgi:hypothetical protein